MADMSELKIEVNAESGITSIKKYESAAISAGKASKLLDDAVAKLAKSNTGLSGSFEDQVRAQMKVIAEANRLANLERQLAQQQVARAAAARELAEAEEQRAQKSAAALDAQARSMARAEAQAYQMDEAIQKAAAGFGLGETGANRLRSSLTGLLTPILQTTGSANVLASTIGSLALGNAVTVGVLGGIAAIALAYDKLTESTRRQKEEQEKATKALLDFANTQRQGVGGQLGADVRVSESKLADQRKQLDFLRQQLAGANVAAPFTPAGVGLVQATSKSSKELQAEYDKLLDAVKAGESELQRIYDKANQDYSKLTDQRLITLVRGNSATLAEQQALRDRLANLQADLLRLTASGGDLSKRVDYSERISAIQAVYDAQAKSAVKAKAEESRAEESFNRQRIEAAQIIARIEANELQQDRLAREAREKANQGIADSIANRQRDIDVVREQIAMLKGNANAYDVLTEARAEEKAVAEARAHLPEDSTLDPKTEEIIRAQVKEWFELSKALEFAKKQRAALDQWNGKNPFELKESIDSTRDLAESLQSVVGIVQLLTTAFGAAGSEASRMIAGASTGTQSILRGIDAAGRLKDAQGGRVTFGRAISGDAGSGAFAAALSATGSIAGGALAIADALDLFGTRARERARQLEEMARQFNAALDDFAISPRTSLQESIRQNAAKATSLAQQAAAASGGTFTGSFAGSGDISVLIAQLQAAADKSKLAREAFGPFIDRLRELEVTTRANEEALRQRNAAELKSLSDDLDVRSLRAAGLDNEATALAASLAATRELQSALEKYGNAAEIAKLQTVQAAEAAKLKADAEKAAAQKSEEDRRRLFDVANSTLALSNPRGAAQAAFDEEAVRRYADAVNRGASANELAAIAAYNFAASLHRAAEIVEADTRVTEGLMNRVFSALGDPRVAQDAAKFSSDRQELADAIKDGMSPSNLALLRFTQFVEREQVGMQRRIEDGTKAIQAAAAEQIKQKDSEIAAEQVRVALSQKGFDDQIAAVKSGADLQIAALDEQRGVLEGILDGVRSQLQTAQEELRISERAYEALSSFANSLNLSAASTLSPTQKLAEAQAQFDLLARQAQTGNADSAANIPAAAQAFLEASRQVNASGTAYAADFARVKQITDALTSQYGGRLNAAQGNVATLQALVESTQKQIDILDEIKAATKDATDATVAKLQALKEADKAASDALLASLADQKQVISDSVQQQIDALVKVETEAFQARVAASEYYATWQRYTEQQMAAAEEFYRQASEYFSPTSTASGPMPVIIQSSDSVPTSDPELKNVVARLEALIVKQDEQISELKAQLRVTADAAKQTLTELQMVRGAIETGNSQMKRGFEGQQFS